jgi:hypothetical protein
VDVETSGAGSLEISGDGVVTVNGQRRGGGMQDVADTAREGQRLPVTAEVDDQTIGSGFA